VKRWKWALLVFELALFALILIMPQVDLPDFTFHGGTAPVLAKARMMSALAASQVVAVAAAVLLPDWISASSNNEISPHPVSSQPSLSLLCLLLC
jgi:hypothetical protein